MKKLILFILSLVFALSFTACSKGVDVSVYKNKIESGKYIRIPELIGKEYDEVEVKDPANKKVRVSNGYFQVKEVGNYVINYTYNGGSKKITIECTPDVSAPYLESQFNIKGVYAVGEACIPDGGDLEDPSGVDKNYSGIRHLEFYYEDETEPCAVGSSYIIEKAGKYTVKLPAKDKLGNTTKYVYTFTAYEPFSDDLPDSVLADFDEEGYLELLGSTGYWGDYTNEFSITSKYPGAEEGTTNKVLYAKPDNKGVNYVLKMDFLKPIEASSAKYIYIKYCLERTIGWNADKTQNYAEYPAALYGVPYSLLDVGLFEYLEPSDGSASNAIFYTFKEGEWATARIPISNLLLEGETTLKGMKFCVAGDLYVDEIWYDNYEFTPENMGEGVLADFNDPNWIYQTKMGLIGDPPALEVLFDGYHGADGKNGVLKISAQTLSSNAVADIKLFETINVHEHPTVYFRIYYDGSVQGSLLYKSFLVFQNSKLTSHQDNRLYYHLIDSTNSDSYTEKWMDIAVDSTVFGGYEDTFDTVSILLEGSVYIDKIWVE